MRLPRFAALPLVFACVAGVHAQEPGTIGWNEATDIRIADRTLIDQAGSARSSKSFMIGDRPTIVSFTFAGCRTICPVSDLMMSAIDTRQSDVNLVTLTIDPLSDSLPVMASQARAISASGRWKWLTGDPRDVWDVNASLGMTPTLLSDHAGFFLVISPGGKEIIRVDGLAGPDDLLRVAQRMTAP